MLINPVKLMESLYVDVYPGEYAALHAFYLYIIENNYTVPHTRLQNKNAQSLNGLDKTNFKLNNLCLSERNYRALLPPRWLTITDIFSM